MFGSWFLSKTIVATLKTYDLKYVSPEESNRVIKGFDMNLKEYTSKVLKERYFKEITIQSNKNTITQFIYNIILLLSNLGDVKLLFIKDKVNGKVKCYVGSNDLKISENEIIKVYKERLVIETDYKNNK